MNTPHPPECSPAEEIHDPLPDDLHALRVSQVQIQTQSYCNGACVICPYSHTSKQVPQGTMPWNLFTRIVDELTAFPSVQQLALMLQNEPLLDRRLPKQIEYVRKCSPDINISITTNGALLTPQITHQLHAAGLTQLVFSINGLTRETFEAIEKGLDFDRVFRNLEQLIDDPPSDLRILVKCMFVKENAVELGLPEAFSDLFERLRAREIPYDVSPISNRAGSLDGYDDMVVFEQMQSSRKKLYCHDIFESTHVLFNGDVLTCCPDWLRKGVLGSMAEDTFIDIWNSPTARRQRERIAAANYADMELCRNCSQAHNILANHA